MPAEDQGHRGYAQRFGRCSDQQKITIPLQEIHVGVDVMDGGHGIQPSACRIIGATLVPRSSMACINGWWGSDATDI